MPRFCSILGPTLAFLPCWILATSTWVYSAGAEHNPSPQRQSNPAVAQARAALASGKPEDAIRVLSAQLQSHPNDISARLTLAEAYVAARQSDQAQAQYEAVLQVVPQNYSALAGLGAIYERAGNPGKAEPLLSRAVELSHGDAEIRTAWAAVLARLHRYGDASRALSGVPAPTSSDAGVAFHRLKAAVASGMGNAEGAASEMEQALRLTPSQTNLQMTAAVAELQAKHWKRAETLTTPLFARTRDANVGIMLLEAKLGGNRDVRPTLEDLNMNQSPPAQESPFRQRIAELLIGYQHFAEAAEELKRAVELDPTRADLKFNLALAQFKAGSLDDALATAQTLTHDSDSAELEDLIGDIEEARGDNLASVHRYEAAVALAPNQEKYRISLAIELMRHNSFEPARVVLKEAEQVNPDSWRVQLALGMVEYFAGSRQDSIKRLLKSAAMADDPVPALGYVGQIEMDEAGAPETEALTSLCEYSGAHPDVAKLGFYCAALRLRRDSISRDVSHADEILRNLNTSAAALPDDSAPHCQLGKAYRWLERWQESLRQSEICARMDPNSADAHYRLAQIYQHLGQQQRSQQEMKLYQAASTRLADENARREETMKKFLYSIQNGVAEHK